MINGKSVSVLITTYIRYKNLDDIIRAWLAQPVEEVWVLDGGGKFKSTISDPRLQVFNMPTDLGPKMDYAFGLLTTGDYIVFADDDVLVKPNFTKDLVACQQKMGGLVGIIGRQFHGPQYHGDTTFYSSHQVPKPVRVGFVGVVILSPREHLGFDIRGLPRNCDDIWWQMRERPNLSKWVAPTTAYINTDECRGPTAMSTTTKLRQERRDFYTKYYLANEAMYKSIEWGDVPPSVAQLLQVATPAARAPQHERIRRRIDRFKARQVR